MLPRLNTEQYNGTAWTEVNDLNTAETMVGNVWNSTAALFWWRTSWHVAKHESWNGSLGQKLQI